MENKYKFALLHNHTTDSIRDSVMSNEELVERASELGITAVAKTEHGTMIGYNEFYTLCREKGILPILGVEAYVTNDVYSDTSDRRHLILMAKNTDGFRAIGKAVTESNEHVAKVGKLSFPLMDKKIIEKWFSRGSLGYGNVYATSACVAGVVAGLWFNAQKADAKVEKLCKKRDELTREDDAQYLKMEDTFAALTEAVKSLQVSIKDLKARANKSTLALEKKVSSAKTEEKKKEAEKALCDALTEKENAKAELEKALSEKEKADAEVKRIRPIFGKMRLSVEKWKAFTKQINDAKMEKMNDQDFDVLMLKEAAWFRDTFAKNDFFIELQYHGMKEEAYLMPKLAEIAKELSIPVVATNDAHIRTSSADDILARQIIRSTRFDKWEEPTQADKEMYLKTEDELREALLKILPENTVEEALRNTGFIADHCNVELKKENHYPKFKTPNGETPEEFLSKMAYAGIEKRYGKNWTEEHQKRLEHELSVICSMGYADYHCIVQDFLEYAREAGKLYLNDPKEASIARTFDIDTIKAYNEAHDRVGECVGPGRGSAAGSIVCYLIGITNIDPLRYDLLFERFLNPERVSMPDIDCDFDPTVRPFVIEYVKHKYGESSVCGIMTKGTQAGKAAIQTAARVLGLQRKGDSVAYADLADAISKTAAAASKDELHLKLKDVEKDVFEAFKDNKIVETIYHYACLIEGSVTQIGQHAAGIIIADGNPVSDYVPLCWNDKNKIMTTQVDMIEAESIGLLKMDFLGLNNLTIITECLRLIKERTGKMINMDSIPFEKEVFENIFSEAMTNSIFQFESAGMKNMLKQFKPGSIDDLVLLVAMFRPGPLQFLPDVIRVKQGLKPITYLVPELEHILSKTYGSITYQEQVQQIFRDLAGYSLGQADIVRRAMSKKKLKVIEAERNAFLYGDPERKIRGCKANGIDVTAANKLFDQMTDFAAYAFNRSHAACYAVVAYQTAWLKYHYTTEYMTAVLNNTPFEKYQGLIGDLKNLNVDIKEPDINKSALVFSISDDEICFGLSSIKGLGDSVLPIIKERENGAFVSLADFVMRTIPSKTVLEGLTWSGAFDSFNKNRSQIADSIPKYLEAEKKYKAAEKKFVSEINEGKKADRLQKLNEQKEEIRNIKLNDGICEDQKQVLSKEYELLGAFVSKQPLDIYKVSGTTPIAEMLESEDDTSLSIAGIITDLQIKNRKKDKAPFATFKLTDKTGSVSVCCFTEPYKTYKTLIDDNAVVIIQGNMKRDEKYTQFITKSMKEPKLNIPPIVVAVKDIDDWMERVRKIVVGYTAENGNPLMIYDEMMDEFRSTDLYVTKGLLQNENLRAKLV